MASVPCSRTRIPFQVDRERIRRTKNQTKINTLMSIDIFDLIPLEYNTMLFICLRSLFLSINRYDTGPVVFPPPTNLINRSSNQRIGHQLPKQLLLTNYITLLIVVLSGYSWFHFQSYRKGSMSVSGQFFRHPHHLRILGCCKAQMSPFFAIGISVPSHIFLP